MANWTVAQDVIDRWIGSNMPTDNDLIEALLSDAEVIILSKFPRIQERIDAETLSIDIVKLVTVRMVSRMLRNPESLTFWQQSTGPFSAGRNYGDKVDIWLSQEEEAMLKPTLSGKVFGVDIGPDKTSYFKDPLWEDLD